MRGWIVVAFLFVWCLCVWFASEGDLSDRKN